MKTDGVFTIHEITYKTNIDEPGESSYVVDAAMPPSSLGWIHFILTPRRTRSKDEDRLFLEINAVQ